MSDDDDFFVPSTAPAVSVPQRRLGSAPEIPRQEEGEPIEEYAQRVHEFAAQRILGIAPDALNALEELINDQMTPPSVRVKATTDLLDRAGLRTPIKVEVSGEIGVAPSEILAERLANLAAGRAAIEAVLTPSDEDDLEDDIDDAEIID